MPPGSRLATTSPVLASRNATRSPDPLCHLPATKLCSCMRKLLAPASHVVAELEPRAQRSCLTAQHISGGHLCRLERLVVVHRHLAGEEARTAGRADARTTGKRQLETGTLGRLE